jgi:hypothetical protein
MMNDEKTEFKDNQKWWGMGRLDPVFESHFPSKWPQRIAKLVAVAVAMIVGVTLVIVVIGAIFDAGHSKRADESNTPAGFSQTGSGVSARCVLNGQEVSCDPKVYAVNKFKAGKMGRASGFTPSRVFTNPTNAKAAFVAKIQTAMNRASRAMSTRQRKAAFPHTATWYYNNAMANASCGGYRPYSPYTSGINVCSLSGPRNKLTKNDIQKMGAATFCGGSVAFGAVTGGTGYFITGWGAASCMWGLWMSF